MSVELKKLVIADGKKVTVPTGKVWYSPKNGRGGSDDSPFTGYNSAGTEICGPQTLFYQELDAFTITASTDTLADVTDCSFEDSIEEEILSDIQGLSQVQSTLASISTTQAALQTALAGVASAEDLDAIADAVADSQADLDDILARARYFNGNVTIDSPQSLDFYYALGNNLDIVNGDVTIVTDPDLMDATKVQTVLDQIQGISGDLNVTYSYSSEYDFYFPYMSFSNLSTAGNITIDGVLPAGEWFSAPNLHSVGTIKDLISDYFNLSALNYGHVIVSDTIDPKLTFINKPAVTVEYI